MSIYAGLDGGSTYLKAALIDHTGKVLNTGVLSTGIDNNGAAGRLLEQLCKEAGVSRIDYTMATGYSRKILELADDDVSEITAHAYGVRITAPGNWRPGLIVDIGGSDTLFFLDKAGKVILGSGSGTLLDATDNVIDNEPRNDPSLPRRSTPRSVSISL